MKEVEVKAKIRNKSEIIQNLAAAGCQLGEPIPQTDTIFVPKEITSLPTAAGVPVLRIREQNGKFILTMKIRLTNGLDKQESETEITNIAAMKEIILTAGFKEMESFSKIRRKTKYNNWEVCVDEVAGLGEFIEVEQLTEDGNSEQIQAELFKFLQSLGVAESDREQFGYDVLIWQNKHA